MKEQNLAFAKPALGLCYGDRCFAAAGPRVCMELLANRTKTI